METTPPSHLALHRDVTPEKTRQLSADGQPKARAPGPNSGHGLLKGVEDPLAIRRWNAGSAIVYVDQ
jgi:hypothetical protein